MCGREEPRLEGGRREVDALREHRVEEGGEAERLLRLGGVVVGHLGIGEEDREHVPRHLEPVRHALLRQRGGDQAPHLRRDRVDLPVGGIVQQPQLRDARGGGDRVPGQGARLVDRAGRGEMRHDVRAAAEGRGREAAAHDLPEGHQIRAYAINSVPTGLADAEAGHHLVGDVERPVAGAQILQALVEARQRRHHAHVARRRLRDHTGDLARVRGERGPYRLDVVVRQHDRVAGLRTRHTRRVGQSEGRHARTGRGQQRVHMPVVAARELDHLRPAGEAACQPDRRHRRLGAAGDQAHLLDRLDPGHDLLGQLDLARAGRAEGRTAGDRVLDRGDHLGVRVAQDHRPP